LLEPFRMEERAHLRKRLGPFAHRNGSLEGRVSSAEFPRGRRRTTRPGPLRSLTRVLVEGGDLS
jgi:hypothetical protein